MGIPAGYIYFGIGVMYWFSLGANSETKGTSDLKQRMFGKAESAAGASESTPKRSKWVSVGVPVLTGVLAFGLGSGAGASGSTSKVESLETSSSQLETRLAQMTTERDDAGSALSTAEAKLKSSEEREKSLEATVAARDKEKAELEAQNQDLSQQVAAAATPVPLVADPPPAVETPPAPTQSVYYRNCTEARNAGVTPLYVGDPGYARHLDRDGDGVACE